MFCHCSVPLVAFLHPHLLPRLWFVDPVSSLETTLKVPSPCYSWLHGVQTLDTSCPLSLQQGWVEGFEEVTLCAVPLTTWWLFWGSSLLIRESWVPEIKMLCGLIPTPSWPSLLSLLSTTEWCEEASKDMVPSTSVLNFTASITGRDKYFPHNLYKRWCSFVEKQAS